jgi:hypothetical protein
MFIACQTFLTARLLELLLADGHTHPYRVDAPAVPDNPAVPGNQGVPAVQGNIFFDELPLDFLKDNDYAACCLPLQDRKKKYGKLIGKARILGEHPKYSLTRRRFERELTFRCLLWAPAAELWSNGTVTGLAEQFDQLVAQYKVIADADNSVIRLEPQDSVRPWDSNVELQKKLRQSPLAIVRIQFTGGLQKVTAVPIATEVTINPHVSGS